MSNYIRFFLIEQLADNKTPQCMILHVFREVWRFLVLVDWILIDALIFVFIIDISPYRAGINGSNRVQLNKSYISFASSLHQAEIVMKSTLTLVRFFF
jgi:hypothetical protein